MEVERGGRHGPEGMAAGGVWEGDEGKCDARGGDDEGKSLVGGRGATEDERKGSEVGVRRVGGTERRQNGAGQVRGVWRGGGESGGDVMKNMRGYSLSC